MADEPGGMYGRESGRVKFNLNHGFSPSSRITGRVVFGLVLCVLGFLWTLDSLDIIDSQPIIDWWPIILVFFGVSRLLGIGSRRHLGIGLAFTIAGTWMLLRRFDVVHVSIFQLWPVILLAVGGMMVWNSLRRTAGVGGEAPHPFGGQTSGTEPADAISTVAIWSGAKHKIISQQFRGGEITAIMGGADLDCRSAHLENGRAVIDLFIWWGGVELRVPEDWQVVNEGFVIMGAIEDKSKAQPAGPVQTLVLRGLVVMGGVEVKN